MDVRPLLVHVSAPDRKPLSGTVFAWAGLPLALSPGLQVGAVGTLLIGLFSLLWLGLGHHQRRGLKKRLAADLARWREFEVLLTSCLRLAESATVTAPEISVADLSERTTTLHHQLGVLRLQLQEVERRRREDWMGLNVDALDREHRQVMASIHAALRDATAASRQVESEMTAKREFLAAIAREGPTRSAVTTARAFASAHPELGPKLLRQLHALIVSLEDLGHQPRMANGTTWLVLAHQANVLQSMAADWLRRAQEMVRVLGVAREQVPLLLSSLPGTLDQTVKVVGNHHQAFIRLREANGKFEEARKLGAQKPAESCNGEELVELYALLQATTGHAEAARQLAETNGPGRPAGFPEN